MTVFQFIDLHVWNQAFQTQSGDESHLIIVNDFSNVSCILLASILCIVFCNYIYQGYWPIVLIFVLCIHVFILMPLSDFYVNTMWALLKEFKTISFSFIIILLKYLFFIF